jgi:hypothetical protein
LYFIAFYGSRAYNKVVLRLEDDGKLGVGSMTASFVVGIPTPSLLPLILLDKKARLQAARLREDPYVVSLGVGSLEL